MHAPAFHLDQTQPGVVSFSKLYPPETGNSLQKLQKPPKLEPFPCYCCLLKEQGNNAAL